MENKCKKCGYDLFPMDKFCDRCGAPVSKQPNVLQESKDLKKQHKSENRHESESQKNNSLIKGIVIGLLIFVLVAAIVVVTVIVVNKVNSDKTVKAPNITDTAADNINQDMPERVEELQHKIDKALESEPTYSQILDIKQEYNDLLLSEQSMINNYDKILAINSVDANVACAVHTVDKLKKILKHPGSLEINSVQVSALDTTYLIVVKIDYAAENDLGGMMYDEYYWEYSDVKNEGDKWTYTNDALQLYIKYQSVGGFNGQQPEEHAKEDFGKYGKIIDIDKSLVIDNSDLVVEERK